MQFAMNYYEKFRFSVFLDGIGKYGYNDNVIRE